MCGPPRNLPSSSSPRPPPPRATPHSRCSSPKSAPMTPTAMRSHTPGPLAMAPARPPRIPRAATPLLALTLPPSPSPILRRFPLPLPSPSRSGPLRSRRWRWLRRRRRPRAMRLWRCSSPVRAPRIRKAARSPICGPLGITLVPRTRILPAATAFREITPLRYASPTPRG